MCLARSSRRSSQAVHDVQDLPSYLLSRAPGVLPGIGADGVNVCVKIWSRAKVYVSRYTLQCLESLLIDSC
jgi:hypothetical protein